MLKIFIAVLLPILVVSQQPVGYKTIMVSELIRHGARTGFGDYDHPYAQEVGIGNLTGNGQRMHFILGQQVKKIIQIYLISMLKIQSPTIITSSTVVQSKDV